MKRWWLISFSREELHYSVNILVVVRVTTLQIDMSILSDDYLLIDSRDSIGIVLLIHAWSNGRSIDHDRSLVDVSCRILVHSVHDGTIVHVSDIEPPPTHSLVDNLECILQNHLERDTLKRDGDVLRFLADR